MGLALDQRGMLTMKRHAATAAEVHSLFVVGAPFPEQRQIIWDAFLVWSRLVRGHLPRASLWLNGGFVTHKPWAPPKDVDVALIAHTDELTAVDWAALGQLLTEHPDGGVRRQPMGGLVDAFVGARGAGGRRWAETWTVVLDKDGQRIASERKGFVEVTDL